MPGPRKNLTPLDMQMLGLAYNQGGVINFLGKQPEVTAPIRSQSHADSPPTQLAYITDAEKDLLVKANIHGSMDGQPNQGPAGLESLDDSSIGSGIFNVMTGSGWTPGGGNAADKGIQKYVAPPSPHVDPPQPDPDPDPPKDTTYQPGGHHPDTTTTTTTDNVITTGESATQPYGSSSIGSIGQTIWDIQHPDTTDYVSGTVIPDTSGSSSIGSIGQMIHDYKYPDTTPLIGYSGKDDEDKGIVETIMGNTLVANLLKGATSTDRFFKKLASGEKLTTEDKIILANLIGAGGLDKINIGKYADKYNVDVTKLGERFTDAASGLTDTDMAGYAKKLERGQDLNKEEIAYLKAVHPELYWTSGILGSDPQTSGGIEELAGQKTIDLSKIKDRNSDEYKQAAAYNNKIFAARELKSKNREEDKANQSGLFTAGGQYADHYYGVPTTPNMDITKPGYTGDPKNPFGLPGDYGAGFMQSQFYKPGTPGLAVMTPVTLPDGTTHMFPDSSSANQFQQYLDHLAMNKMGPSVGSYQAVGTGTGVGSLDWSQFGPHFGPQYPGHYSHWGSGYANGGIARLFNQHG